MDEASLPNVEIRRLANDRAKVAGEAPAGHAGDRRQVSHAKRVA